MGMTFDFTKRPQHFHLFSIVQLIIIISQLQWIVMCVYAEKVSDDNKLLVGLLGQFHKWFVVFLISRIVVKGC